MCRKYNVLNDQNLNAFHFNILSFVHFALSSLTNEILFLAEFDFNLVR